MTPSQTVDLAITGFYAVSALIQLCLLVAGLAGLAILIIKQLINSKQTKERTDEKQKGDTDGTAHGTEV